MNCLRIGLVILQVCMLFLPAFRSVAAEESGKTIAVPAQWVEGADAFTSDLACPRELGEGEGAVRVFCQVELNTKGRKVRRACFTESKSHRRFKIAAERALKKLKYEPAMQGGEPVRVLVSSLALFVNKQGECAAIGLPNWGVNVEQFGIDYIAPQEILTDGGWAREARSTLQQIRTRAQGMSGIAFMLAAEVSVEGKPRGVQFIETNFSLGKIRQQAVVEAYSASRYIPGYFHGRLEKMNVMEVYYLRPQVCDEAHLGDC